MGTLAISFLAKGFMTPSLSECGWFACQDMASALAWWRRLGDFGPRLPTESMVLTLSGHVQRQGQALLLSSWSHDVAPEQWCPEFQQEAALAFDCALWWAVACRLAQPLMEPPPSPALVAASIVSQARDRLGEEHSPDLAYALLRLEAVHARSLKNLFPAFPSESAGVTRRAEDLVMALGSVVDLLDGSRPGMALPDELKQA